jgi:hypothetical protein
MDVMPHRLAPSSQAAEVVVGILVLLTVLMTVIFFLISAVSAWLAICH